MRATLRKASVFLIALAASIWAASTFEAAPLSAASTHIRTTTKQPETLATSTSVPQPVRLREEKQRGLLAETWINGRGPYRFAVDTGAGISLVSDRLVAEAGIRVNSGRRTISGISGRGTVSTREAVIDQIALGYHDNLLPGQIRVLVAPVPEGIDGILDPTEAFAPLGYSIDIPNLQLRAFDPKSNGLNLRKQPPDGTTVRWIRDRESSRPFVRLGDGRLALLDTGSGLGLGIRDPNSSTHERGRRDEGIHDLGGGTFQVVRVEPSTVTINALVLRGVPTDILRGVAVDTPVILGRDALFPFRITFDPLNRLIEIAPAPDNR
ncbi:MAG TPA: retropepsin-like aspartic protease [Pyrinomonadaceae bacterium]|nr:retropepsin-like aspartic protease [Pyrinomonadaceae bacterium]